MPDSPIDGPLPGEPIPGVSEPQPSGVPQAPAPQPAAQPPASQTAAPQPAAPQAEPGQPVPAPPASTWGQAALSGEKTTGETTTEGATESGFPAGSGSAASGGGGGGGGGHSSRSSAPRGPKPIRGPRFSASPLIAGLGLLGLLVTVAIMALLAVRVLDGMNSTAKKVNSPTLPGPGGALVPVEPVPDGGQASGGNVTDAARAATCAASKSVIETAVETYSTIEGSQPATIDDLVSTGFLQSNDGTFKLEPAPSGTVAVVGVGVCETVN